MTEAVREKGVASSFVATSLQENGAQNASSNATDTSSSDPIDAVTENAISQVIGAYAGLQQQGIFSSSTGAVVAGQIGLGLQTPVSYTALTASSIQTISDTSYGSMMNYRAALQTSLKPLLNNTMPEYEIFGLYVQTKDQKYLDELHTAAGNYRVAASSTAIVTTPEDAVSVELGLVNSMN